MEFKTQKPFIVAGGITIRPDNQITKDFGGLYLSYNPRTPTSGYGTEPTTCLVIRNKVNSLFLSLLGDHREGYGKLEQNLDSCLGYFIDHIDETSSLSEHRLILREGNKLLGIPSKEEIKVLLGGDNYRPLEVAVKGRLGG